jgi:DNA-binding protein H-NS
MSRLSTIRKQIAALEAQAARIAKEEMDSAIGKVRSLMSDFGLTIEHLTQSVTGKSTPRKAKSAPKKSAAKKAASIAKYADPKSGKTWSGFGRAPGWIAGAKNRDAFLVNKSAAPVASTKKAAAKKAAKAAVAPVKKTAATVAQKKAVPVTKKAAASTGKASASAKKIARKKAAPKKSAARKAAASGAASTSGAAAPAAE